MSSSYSKGIAIVEKETFIYIYIDRYTYGWYMYVQNTD